MTRYASAAACLMLCCLAHGQNLTRAELNLGDVSAQWRAAEGLRILFRGADAFSPYSSEFTEHDGTWAKTRFTSRHGDARGVLDESADSPSLMVSEGNERFSYSKRITVLPENRLRVDYEFGQNGLEDSHLQLGWRPGVHWLDGAMYSVTANGQTEEGRMTYGRADRRVLWSGMTAMRFTSVFGSWSLTSTHPMTLYDDRDQGSFFLGWDQNLEDAVRYKETLEIGFDPAGTAAPGLALSGFGWSRKTELGRAWVKCALAREEQGPQALELALEALVGEKVFASERARVELSAAPGVTELSLPLSEPGAYDLRWTASDPATGQEVLRVQGLRVDARALLQFMPALSLYTGETQAELLVKVLDELPPEGLSARISGPTIPTQTVPVNSAGTVVGVEMAGLADGRHEVECVLLQGENELARTRASFTKAPPKPNEVKVDYRSRGLIVDGKPYFPFGFYIHMGQFYDQEDPEYVLELEGAFKFNMICVYHNFPLDFRREKRDVTAAFLDEADAVGMRMHYDVRSMTDEEPSQEISAALAEDVNAHKDAPGLLCWYLSDEPCGRNIPPDRYVAHNAHVKELDPYHPTTMVFCVPSKAHEYRDGMDILMVDPYPIPNHSVTNVADTVDLVLGATGYTMPVWCVPQAFGGGEWWGREPTWQEQRCMTYMAIAHGATGIQYFIRRPPHNNPFVDGMWAECRKIAAEIKELTPALLSHEPAPEIVSQPGDSGLHLTARAYSGAAYVLCVNSDKTPKSIELHCGAAPVEDKAQVLFEDRSVTVSQDGVIRDMIDALGVRIYCYRTAPEQANLVALDPSNKLRNGGFEAAASPGFPDYFRVGQGAHRGSSWGTDPLESVEGSHSLFMRSPAEEQGPSVSSYPMHLTAGKYRLSVYLKSDREGQQVLCNVSGFKDSFARTVEVGTGWQELSAEFEVAEDARFVHLSVRGLKRGVVWVDAAQVIPVQ